MQPTTDGENRTAFRGSSIDTSSSPLSECGAALVPPSSPNSRASRVRPVYADAKLVDDERGVDGADVVDVAVDADGDVERLAERGLGLKLDAAGFFMDDRAGCGARLDAKEGGRGVCWWWPGSLRTSGATAAPCMRRACAGPRCGVREVCRPIAICAMDGGGREAGLGVRVRVRNSGVGVGRAAGAAAPFLWGENVGVGVGGGARSAAVEYMPCSWMCGERGWEEGGRVLTGMTGAGDLDPE